MSLSRMNDSEKEWLKNFNFAMTGNKKALQVICPDKDKFQVIFKDMEAKRDSVRKKDLMQRGQRVGAFIADIDYVIKKQEISQTWAEAKSKNNYEPKDYQMNKTGVNTIEDTMAEFLDNKQQAKRTQLSSIKELKLGTEVKIWLEDHIYDKQIGTVIDMRDNGQYLVQITSRVAPKRYHHEQIGEAQMWVFPNEIRIYP